MAHRIALMTVRSEGQFNTVVYEDDDIYRGQDRRDVILLHPDDIARLGFDRRPAGHRPQRAGSMPNILVPALRRNPRRQRADVLSRGQRAGAARRRSAIEDAGVQEHSGQRRSGSAATTAGGGVDLLKFSVSPALKPCTQKVPSRKTMEVLSPRTLSIMFSGRATLLQ